LFFYYSSDIHLFKENLKPMWEEEGNRLGGKWILRLKKGLSTRLWELLILAVVGEQFNVGKEICGIVCSIRPQEDLISVWTKTANNQVVTQRIKETMKKVLCLPQDCKIYILIKFDLNEFLFQVQLNTKHIMIHYVIIVVIAIQIVFGELNSKLSTRYLFSQIIYHLFLSSTFVFLSNKLHRHFFHSRCVLVYCYDDKHILFLLFKMTDKFFQPVNPLWYPACDGGLLQLGVLAFWPNIMPYEYMGLFGQFLKHLAYSYHYTLINVFWIAIFLHVFEAIVAIRLCKKLNMDSDTTRRWFIQTLLLGYVSLGKLRAHAAKKR
jgi:hypothetical protein